METTHSTGNKGYGLFPFIEVFQETFEKSGAACLEAYLAKRPLRRWMVFSDYAFYAESKQADVFVLSLVPWFENFNEVSAQLQELSFKDIKSLKQVNPEFIEFLRHGPFFNVAVMLPKNRQLVHDDERQALLNFLSSMCGMLEDWRESTPEQKSYYVRCLKDLKHIERLIRDRRVKLELVRDMVLVASVVSYFMFKVAKAVHVDRIGWFSDRDSMLDYQSSKLTLPLVFQLVHTYFHVLCDRAMVPSYDNPVLGKPETLEDGRLFYDSFLRVPDLIAGTLADMTLEDQSFSHTKFEPVLDGLLRSNDNTCVFILRDDKPAGGFEAVRLVL